MRRNWLFLAIALASTTSALARGLPKYVGQCSLTRVEKVEPRLFDGLTNQPILGSGSVITFANRGHQVSYEQNNQVDNSHSGDLVRMCLVSNS